MLSFSDNACAQVKCKGLRVCVLNIQGLPLCRCPSVFFCRQRQRQDICGRDGYTYKSRCYLRIAECTQSRKIRVAHEGHCKGGKKRKRMDELEKSQPVPIPIVHVERPTKPNRLFRQERPERKNRPWRVGKVHNHNITEVDKAFRGDRVHRPGRPDRLPRPNRMDKVDRPHRLVGRIEKPVNWMDKTDRSDKSRKHKKRRDRRRQKKKQRRRDRIKRRLLRMHYYTG